MIKVENQNYLEQLIKNFSQLPSIGPRSARRLVLNLINNKEDLMHKLINSLQLVKDNIKNCQKCANLTVNEICEICVNPKRDHNVICIVENVADLWALEKSQVFTGIYHILGGTLSAMSGVGPDDLNIDKLLKRIDCEQISEVIIATNATMEGQTTAHYLAQILKNYEIKISKLANGIPIGSEIDYLDQGTIGIAFNLRTKF